MSLESKIQTDIRLRLSQIGSGTYLRYNVGTFLTMDGRPVKIGMPGVSDLIGFTTHVITPEDVGRTVAIFTAIETKQKKDSTSKDRKESQGNFMRLVNAAGGIAGIARSVDDAVDMVTAKWKSKPVLDVSRIPGKREAP